MQTIQTRLKEGYFVDYRTNHVSFFFNCIIIIVRCNCPKKNKDENGFVLEDEEKAVLGMLSSHASYKQVCH